MDKKFKEWFENKKLTLHVNPDLFNILIEWSQESYKLGKEARKQNKIEADPCYPEFVRIWVDAYPDLGFGSMDGKKIKSLIVKTKAYLEAGGREPSMEGSISMWAYIVTYLKRGESWYHGKDLGVIESKYTAIIFEIKNGKQSSKSKSESATDYIKSFRKGA